MSGVRLSYRNPRLLRTVLYQLQQQQQTGQFCDVTLQGDGEGILVHSCVIAACSPYLANLLTFSTAVSNVSDPKTPMLANRHVLRIHGIESLHLFPLVHYMYTSELEMPHRAVSGVLKAAQKLQIPELELLKLEGGRLLRAESGRRLNRNCLSSKTQTLHTKVIKEAKAVNEGMISLYTPLEIKPTINCQNKIEDDETSVSVLDIKQNNNKLDSEIISSGSSVIQNVLSSGSSLEELVEHSPNVPSSHNLLQDVPSNQNSQPCVPLNHNLINIVNRHDLIDNASIGQNVMQDVISNQNSPVDAASSLNLLEYELKGTLDSVPNNHNLLEQTVNVCSLLDIVQCSQDLLDKAQSTQRLTEDAGPVVAMAEDAGPVVAVAVDAGPVVAVAEDAGPVVAVAEDAGPVVAVAEDAGPVVAVAEDAGPVVAVAEDAGPVVAVAEDAGPVVAVAKDAGRVVGVAEDAGHIGRLSDDDARGQDTQENLLKTCNIASQNQSNPEVISRQERKCLVEGQQSRYHTQSRKRLLKSVRVDNKSEEVVSVETEFLKLSPTINSHNIDISASKFEKQNLFNVGDSCLTADGLDNWQDNVKQTVELSGQLPDESDTWEDEDAGYLGVRKRCKLKATETNVLYKDKTLIDGENNDSPVSDVKLNYSVPHTSLESLKEASSGLMMEMQDGTVDYLGLKSSIHCECETVEPAALTSNTNSEAGTSMTVDLEAQTARSHCESAISGTVDQEGLTSPTPCEPETNSDYAYNIGINETKKSPHNLDNSFDEVEKLKLRKANDGLSWEVVRNVESLSFDNEKKHLKELEEQVERILNVTTQMSPDTDVDVGVYSPTIYLEKCVWPDMSSESDMEIDVFG